MSVYRTTVAVAFCSALLVSGCTSMTSTMLSRHDDDNFSVNHANGGHVGTHIQHTKGIPITLSVFTHLDVRIVETVFLQQTERGLEPVRHMPILSVDSKPVRTKKVFTVDFKRPAAGTLDYAADFDEEQYFKNFKNKIVDKTLEDITYAMDTVQGIMGTPTSRTEIDGSIRQNLIVAKRHVAYQRFDINAPDFEDQLAGFAQMHFGQ